MRRADAISASYMGQPERRIAEIGGENIVFKRDGVVGLLWYDMGATTVKVATFMRIFLFVLLCFVNTPLQGETTKTKAIPSSNSQQNRADQQWQATVGLGDLYPLIGARARWGYFLDPDSILFLDLSGGSNEGVEVLSLFTTNSDINTQGKKASLGFKQFLANSFYWEGNGYYWSIRRLESHYPIDYEYSSQAIGAEFRLGNQWQWRHFTLGCDWIGLHIPISVFGEKSQYGDDSEFFIKKKKVFEAFEKSVLPIVAGFYLGFSF